MDYSHSQATTPQIPSNEPPFQVIDEIPQDIDQHKIVVCLICNYKKDVRLLVDVGRAHDVYLILKFYFSEKSIFDDGYFVDLNNEVDPIETNENMLLPGGIAFNLVL